MNYLCLKNGVLSVPDMTNIVVVAGSIATAIISAVVVVRGQKMSTHVSMRDVENDRVKTIFDGYGSIVDDLRAEVARLKEVIEGLQLEQDECLKQNNSLLAEVELLKQRLNHLEVNNGRTTE
jgi:FtsZ-binding cell division protein ZapB